MGIKSLGAWLRKEIPQVIHEIPIKSFGGQRLAVDASVYLYKFICIANSGRGNYFDMFLGLILHLMTNNIRPVFVFDGPPPPEKDRTKNERKANRVKLENKVQELEELIEIVGGLPFNEDLLSTIQERVDTILNEETEDYPRKKVVKLLNDKYKKVSSQCIYVTTEDVQRVKSILDCLGLPWIQAVSEAEKTCSWLCFWEYVKGVITTDTDVIAYGAPIFIKDVSAGKSMCSIIRHEDVLTDSGLTKTEFTDFCIMCGTDYNKNIAGIGPAKAYLLIQKHRTLEEVSKTSLDTSVLYYNDARRLFTLDPNIPQYKIPRATGLNYEKLSLLLVKCNSRYSVEEIKGRIFRPRFIVV